MDDQYTYSKAGVNSEREETSMHGLIEYVKMTWALPRTEKVKLDIGFFANVVDIGNNVGLAVSTDGVGTKILVAQMMDRYDTVGIDCVAMNVNDVLCVGAKPICMLDYLAVQEPSPRLLSEIGKGLYEGARLAEISIPGGELAQVRDMLKGVREGYAFDLVGTAIGIVPMDRIIAGENLEDGDVIIGIRSNGIHSNGLTLARKVLFERAGLKVTDYIDELGSTVGEELLKPTHIYVKEILEIIRSGINVKSLSHITGDGLLNLPRTVADVSYDIENLPEPHPIFNLIQKLGNISDEEMFSVYNMGIGFCVVVPPSDVKRAMSILKQNGREAFEIGHVINDGKRQVLVRQKSLVGKGKRFSKQA